MGEVRSSCQLTSQWVVPAEEKENCPACGGDLFNVFTEIGGFPGHMFTHRGSLWGYECPACHRRFSLGELAKLKEGKAREKKSDTQTPPLSIKTQCPKCNHEFVATEKDDDDEEDN